MFYNFMSSYIWHSLFMVFKSVFLTYISPCKRDSNFIPPCNLRVRFFCILIFQNRLSFQKGMVKVQGLQAHPHVDEAYSSQVTEEQNLQMFWTLINICMYPFNEVCIIFSLIILLLTMLIHLSFFLEAEVHGKKQERKYHGWKGILCSSVLQLLCFQKVSGVCSEILYAIIFAHYSYKKAVSYLS